MRRLIPSLLFVSAFAILQACSNSNDPSAADPEANEAAARQAKVAYLAGINSNNLNQFLSTITDDVVYVAPNTPVLVGKAVVGEWERG